MWLLVEDFGYKRCGGGLGILETGVVGEIVELWDLGKVFPKEL